MNKKEYFKQYYLKHKEKILNNTRNYRNTPIGRAVNLIGGYKEKDTKYNRGDCTLTADWIVENIFSGQKCVYCGESDWKKLGCDRIDDSLPHTPENCQPCCFKCNDKKPKTNLWKPVLQYDKEGNLVKEWSSATQCRENGFNDCHISECCNGQRKTHKGYIWKYKKDLE